MPLLVSTGNTYVCGMCTCSCVYACTYVHMGVEDRDWLWAFPFISSSAHVWSKVSHWACNTSAQRGWLASETPGSACLALSVLGLSSQQTSTSLAGSSLWPFWKQFIQNSYSGLSSSSSTLSSCPSVPAVPSRAFVSISLVFFMVFSVLLFIGVIWAGALYNYHVGEAAPPWSPWVYPLENVFYEGKLQFLSLSGLRAASAAHHSTPLSVRSDFPLVVLLISLRAYLVWPRSLFLMENVCW